MSRTVLALLAVGAVSAAQPPAGRESVPATAARKGSEGRLNKTLFVATSTAAKGFKPLEDNLKDHLAYLGRLEREGKLFMAGPLFDADPERWSGDGLLVYSAADFAEAKRLAENDPLHKSGARTFVLRPWLANDGCLTLRFTLSNRSAELP